jgi:hypothetical protein
MFRSTFLGGGDRPPSAPTTSQRISWAFLAGKKLKVFFSRHHGTKHDDDDDDYHYATIKA